jgi:TIR domain/Pentapeptide repeats (8 copies)
MANPEHLQMLAKGVEVWNQWRSKNRGVRLDLTMAILSGANLSGATLSGATLSEANLFRANLTKASLFRANLSGATLREAALSEANLIMTNLTKANLIMTNLTKANFFRANLGVTVFGATDLSTVQGLETCRHNSPSILDHHTLAKSGPLPLAFLRGCGLNDWEIEATKLYQPGLTPTQIDSIVYRISDLRADPSIQFYSCFISYASQDQTFAEHLYSNLQNKGVRCWYAPEDMKIGDEFRSRIDTSIHHHDRLLLILSEHAIKSRWVQKEVETAFEKEARENRIVLFPLRLDDAIIQVDVGWAADIRRQRHIGDFTQWKEHDAYQYAFTRLLRDLTTAERQPGR